MLKHFQLIKLENKVIKLENKVHKVQSASPFLIFEFVGEVLSGIKQKTGWAAGGNLLRWRKDYLRSARTVFGL